MSYLHYELRVDSLSEGEKNRNREFGYTNTWAARASIKSTQTQGNGKTAKDKNKKRGDHQIQPDSEADNVERLPKRAKPCIQRPTKPIPGRPSSITLYIHRHGAYGPRAQVQNRRVKKKRKKRKQGPFFFVHPCGKFRSDMHRNHAMSLFHIFCFFLFLFF